MHLLLDLITAPSFVAFALAYAVLLTVWALLANRYAGPVRNRLDYLRGNWRPLAERGAVGVGAVMLQNIPVPGFVVDPTGWAKQTRQNIATPESVTHPSTTGFFTMQLPQTGIVESLELTFDGTITIPGGGAAITWIDWPYGLLRQFSLSVNGQTNLWNVGGVNLHVKRFIRYPSFTDQVDVFPGTLGGSASTIAAGTYDVHLTFLVDLGMDPKSMLGSIFAQSGASNFSIRVDINNNGLNIAGTWSLQETYYGIPIVKGPENRDVLLIPDLTGMHGCNEFDFPFSNTGPVKNTLTRADGNLIRLYLAARSSATNRLSAQPDAASTAAITEIQLGYGINENPYDFLPGANLLKINNEDYGAPAPYDRMIFDFIRRNADRDVVHMMGITDLAPALTVGSGVTVTDGHVTALMETLF